MRVLSLATAIMALVLAGPARAQDWIEFYDPVWGIQINFPGQPAVEDIEYMTFEERAVPARVFTATRGSGRYTLTAVAFSTDPSDSLTAVSFASQAILDKGEVTYFAYHQLDGIPGQMMSVTAPDGRLIQACVYFVDQRLYIAEGSVAAGDAAPSHFQQSINMVDASGKRITFD